MTMSELPNSRDNDNSNSSEIKNVFEFGTVCIVDDEPANLFLLESILKNNFYDTITTTDGDNALELIKSERPDLILLDIMISPEIDGYEICQKLKEDDTTQRIPVIFISALDQSIEKIKAFEVGGVDYITKPFQAAEVLARVQTHLTQHQIQNQLVIQYSALQEEIKRRKQVEKELEQTNKQLEKVVTIDSLTGLYNRRHFNNRYKQEWKRMIREKKSLALILCDIDNFEDFNRTHGPHAGDLVLQKIAQVLKKTVKRPGDIVARWGEDEFILLLPRTDSSGAETLAEKILKNSDSLDDFSTTENVMSSVVLSIGIASILPGFGHSKNTLLSNASEALSRVKNSRAIISIFDEGDNS